MSKHFLFCFMIVLMIVGCNGGGEPTAAITPVENQPTAEPSTPEITHIRLPMGYIADPQFAPFYVALEKGYFAAENLEVEFDYSFETDGVALVGANELQFAIASGDLVVLARAQQLPVVSILQWFQKYPIALISKQEAGITRPEDLAGHTVGLPGFFGAGYLGYIGLLESAGLHQEDVQAQEIGYTQIEALKSDQVEVVVGYVNNEPIQLSQQGLAINVLSVADYVDMVANGIITNEKTLTDNPDLVQAFVQAVLRGLADTLADPAGAYEISKKYVEGLDDSRLAVLEASLPLWQAETLGLSNEDAWAKTQDILLTVGLLDAPLADVSKLFNNDFVLAAQP